MSVRSHTKARVFIVRHGVRLCLCVVCPPPASDSRVVSCAAVWRMPTDWETGSHESPDDTTHNPQTLELLCHLDDSAHGNAAW